MIKLWSTNCPLSPRHAPDKLPPASGTKLKGIAYIGGQCSLVLDIGEDVDMQYFFFNYIIILSIYGYYPNVEYRRFINLVVR